MNLSCSETCLTLILNAAGVSLHRQGRGMIMTPSAHCTVALAGTWILKPEPTCKITELSLHHIKLFRMFNLEFGCL